MAMPCIVQAGDFIMKDNCTKKCVCNEPGDTELTCSDHKCPENAECTQDGGRMDCRCKEGFTDYENECLGEKKFNI